MLDELGDSYGRTSEAQINIVRSLTAVIWTRCRFIGTDAKFWNRSECSAGIKPKTCWPSPGAWRFALQDAGWWLRREHHLAQAEHAECRLCVAQMHEGRMNTVCS